MRHIFGGTRNLSLDIRRFMENLNNCFEKVSFNFISELNGRTGNSYVRSVLA